MDNQHFFLYIHNTFKKSLNLLKTELTVAPGVVRPARAFYDVGCLPQFLGLRGAVLVAFLNSYLLTCMYRYMHIFGQRQLHVSPGRDEGLVATIMLVVMPDGIPFGQVKSCSAQQPVGVVSNHSE